jgi:hypothetical protein
MNRPKKGYWSLLTALAFTVIILSGCAATPDDFSPYIHQQAEKIPLFDEGNTPDQDFIIIEEITSNSCDSKSVARYAGDMEEARLLLKLKAAKLNADAVIDVHCWTSAVDLFSNCWAAKKCKGLAVKKK